ncbi:MAG: hypothetical protein HZA20_13755 [Nitrospirae bacterium]|jgi:hypothetical protein|nr:hypothetical protein [Nitrospirota bacterium]
MKSLSKKLVLGMFAMFVMAFTVGCSQPPTQEAADAKAGIDAVVADGGEIYAKDELKGLHDATAAAADEVKTQEAKIFKNFDKAREMYVKVKGDAANVKGMIPARKEAAKQAAVAAQEAAKAAVASATELLKKAPKGKGSIADLEAMKADVAGFEAALADVQGQIGKEDFFGATDKANAIKSKAESIGSEITAALEKVKAPKGKKAAAKAAPAAKKPAGH